MEIFSERKIILAICRMLLAILNRPDIGDKLYREKVELNGIIDFLKEDKDETTDNRDRRSER